MRINALSKFPYPVLFKGSDDYKYGEFHFSLNNVEEKNNGEVILDYSIVIDSKGISGLVTKNEALVGLFVTCVDTFYRTLIPINVKSENIVFPRGSLNGRVTVRPFIYSNTSLKNYSSEDLHEEFETVIFPRGAILAYGEEYNFEIGHDKRAPLANIFTFAIKDELEAGQFEVLFDDEKITIQINTTTQDVISKARNGTNLSKQIIVNGVYLPAVMEVLFEVKNGDNYADKRWHKIISAKCRDLGIDIKVESPLIAAQKLLKFPFKSLATSLDKELFHD